MHQLTSLALSTLIQCTIFTQHRVERVLRGTDCIGSTAGCRGDHLDHLLVLSQKVSEVVLKVMSHDMRTKNSNTFSCMLNSPSVSLSPGEICLVPSEGSAMPFTITVKLAKVNACSPKVSNT